VNLAKALLYAINGGRDEISGTQIAPASLPVSSDVLEFDEVMAKFDATMEWLARTSIVLSQRPAEKSRHARRCSKRHTRGVRRGAWISISPGMALTYQTNECIDLDPQLEG
jgi:hypothetical protein